MLWLASHGPDFTAAVAPLVPGMVTDGWLIGAASADAMVGGRSTADVGGWKPGDTATATDTVASLGLGRQLAAALKGAQDQAQAIADGVRASLARALLDGAAAGATAAVIGKTLVGVLSDAAKATSAALGQLVDAIGQAAMALYRLVKVEYVEWLTEDGNACPVCLGNEAQGPIPLGTPFDSGDTDAPAHPHCRCAVIPSRAP